MGPAPPSISRFVAVILIFCAIPHLALGGYYEEPRTCLNHYEETSRKRAAWAMFSLLISGPLGAAAGLVCSIGDLFRDSSDPKQPSYSRRCAEFVGLGIVYLAREDSENMAILLYAAKLDSGWVPTENQRRFLGAGKEDHANAFQEYFAEFKKDCGSSELSVAQVRELVLRADQSRLLCTNDLFNKKDLTHWLCEGITPASLVNERSSQSLDVPKEGSGASRILLPVRDSDALLIYSGQDD